MGKSFLLHIFAESFALGIYLRYIIVKENLWQIISTLTITQKKEKLVFL